MDIKAIERMMLFASVAEFKSFTDAAEKLDVSKSHLSQQVKALEAMLGVQLLIRTTRHLKVTAAGEELLKQLPKLNDFWFETNSRLSAIQEASSGLVKITSPLALAECLLWPKLAEFQIAYPDISIELDVGNQTYDLVQSGFDLAIRITDNPPENMVGRELIRVQYYCYASPEYIEKFGVPESPDDLNRHNCLALSHWPTWEFFDASTNYQIKPTGSLRANSNQILKRAAIRGQGIIRVPHYMVDDEVSTGRLVRLLPNYQHVQRSVYLIYPQMQARPIKTQNCIDFLINAFNK